MKADRDFIEETPNGDRELLTFTCKPLHLDHSDLVEKIACRKGQLKDVQIGFATWSPSFWLRQTLGEKHFLLLI